MKQVVQPSGGGKPVVVEAPAPALDTASVLVATSATLISAGTERAATRLAQANLAQKAKARPDLVKQVLRKAQTDGIRATLAAVRSKLEDDLALGYSGAGRILEVGPAVTGFSVGDRVATAGGGHASHAEIQSVPWTLAARVPDAVSDEAASFATVASVGLHGLRLADMSVGSKVVVVGLGLIGQLTARMAVASGCDVFGVDLDPRLTELAARHGVTAAVEAGATTTDEILAWSRGRGADSIVITAGAHGDSRIVRAAPERCRDRGIVVAVGDVGLDLERNAFYHKELELRVARSYGPGRYDRSYEEWGVDYPVGHVRWTEGRNLEAVLDLLADGRLEVADLVTHRFRIDDAVEAYQALDDPEQQPLGIVLSYPERPNATTTVKRSVARRTGPPRRKPRVGIIGVGNFVRGVVVPSLEAAGAGPITHVVSASGVTAARFAERYGVARASSDPDAVITDPDVDLVVVATPHSTHAGLVASALRSGKDVYCEKPLAIDSAQLQQVLDAYSESEGRLYVGFNRRYAPILEAAKQSLVGAGPVQIQYRISAGPISPDHWYADHREGGRLVGEVCHFVDACSYLVDDVPAVTVSGVGPSGSGDHYHLLLGFSDGSSASILYGDRCHPSTPKERLEVTGRGHTLEIDNYRTLTVDGSRRKVAAGKGHVEGLRSFLSGADNTDPGAALQTTAIVLEAAERIRS